MRLLAICCYVVAALAEVGGLTFAVLAFRTNRQVIQRWRAANPEGHREGSAAQLMEINSFVTNLLDEPRWRQQMAVGLIALGILAGTVGNFTGLPAS